MLCDATSSVESRRMSEAERLFLGAPQYREVESAREVDDGQVRRLAAVNDRSETRERRSAVN
jgi:hypothetical protein